MSLKLRNVASLVAVALALVASDRARGQITVDSTDQFTMQGGNGLKSVNDLTFDAGGSDKLVVAVSTEHGFNNGNGDITDIKYNGTSLTQAAESKVDRGTAEIWYLDNPGSIGSGTIEIQGENPNGGIGTAYALSGTSTGFGATGTSWTDTGTTSVSLTTTQPDSLVIAVIDNSGNPNNAGTPTAESPLTQVSSDLWGSNNWGGHASGYQHVSSPGLATSPFTTNTGSGYSINMAAAEFLPCSATFTFSNSSALGGVQFRYFDIGGTFPFNPYALYLAVFPEGDPAADWEVREPFEIYGNLEFTESGTSSVLAPGEETPGIIIDTVMFPSPSPPLFEAGHVDAEFSVPDCTPYLNMPLYIVFSDQGPFSLGTKGVISTGLSFQPGPVSNDLDYVFDDPATAWFLTLSISGDGANYRNGFSEDSTYDSTEGLRCADVITNNAEGKWRFAGENKTYSLAEMCMPPGTYDLEFEPVAGYLTPSPQTLEILADTSIPAPVVIYDYTSIETPWDEWVFDAFPPSQHSDPLITGPLKDPDNDRISNLLERAFHLDPTRSGPQARPPGSLFGGLPSPAPVDLSGPRVTLDFVRLKDPAAAGLSYHPEFGVRPDSLNAPGSELSTESLDDDWERVLIEGPAGASQGYGRVRVERIDP